MKYNFKVEYTDCYGDVIHTDLYNNITEEEAERYAGLHCPVDRSIESYNVIKL